MTACRQPDVVDACYRRSQRILKTDEFSSVFRLRPVVRTSHFTLYVRANSGSVARLGVVVAKRLAPRAVTRNLVKRLARECFRQGQFAPVDCVIRLAAPTAKRGSPARTQALKKQLRGEILQLMAGVPRSGAES